MSKGNLVRCIGGPAAGEVMRVQGDTFRVPQHPDMVVCPKCDQGGIPQPEPIHTATYRVIKLHFGTGHRHLYATPAGVPLVSALNAMWHEYRKAKEKQK